MLLLCYKNVTTHKAPFSLIQQQISENVTIVTTFSDIYYKAFSEVLFFLCNICNIVTNVIKKQRIGSAATFVSGYTPVDFGPGQLSPKCPFPAYPALILY